jgi:hypothetical protein
LPPGSEVMCSCTPLERALDVHTGCLPDGVARIPSGRVSTGPHTSRLTRGDARTTSVTPRARDEAGPTAIPQPRPDRDPVPRPAVDGGRYPVKRCVGDRVEVSVDVFRDGHDLLRAVVRYRGPGSRRWRSPS